MCTVDLRKFLRLLLYIFIAQSHFELIVINCSCHNFDNLNHFENCHLKFQSLSFYFISAPNIFLFDLGNHFQIDWIAYHNYQ